MATDKPANVTNLIGSRICKGRKERGLTQEQLAAPQFTKGYISALERGSIRPSLKALEYIATKLDLPVSHFITGIEENSVSTADIRSLTGRALDALEEDLTYQYNFARMLIRQGDESSIATAFDEIEAAELHADTVKSKLPARLLYRPHFLRGIAFLQALDPARARPELERAQEEARNDENALVTVQNMLGSAHYLMSQAHDALRLHLECLHAVEAGKIKDLSLRLSILHNLANDYWALRDIEQAIATYKRALPLVEDLNGTERQANLFWALAMAYRTANDRPHAKLYALRALHLYERIDDELGATSVCLHLGELFIQDGRFDEAQSLLDKAHGFAEKNNNLVLLASIYSDYADLNRQKGNLTNAIEHSRKGLSIIRQVAREGIDEDSTNSKTIRMTPAPPINIVRALVEALHVSAQIEEELGNYEAASKLYKEAMEQVSVTDLTELLYTIAFSYGEVLNARGDYEQASEHYRIAAKAVSGPKRPSI